MEFILGALLSILIYLVINSQVKMNIEQSRILDVSFTQSSIHKLTSPYNGYYGGTEPKELITQATRHHDTTALRVVIREDLAYWIQNDTLYMADVTEQGVDGNSTRKVDTMALDTVELTNMILIVDKLTEGKGSSANPNSGNA